jgi:hypothetical protein
MSLDGSRSGRPRDAVTILILILKLVYAAFIRKLCFVCAVACTKAPHVCGSTLRKQLSVHARLCGPGSKQWRIAQLGALVYVST